MLADALSFFSPAAADGRPHASMHQPRRAATEELRHLFRRLGLSPLVLGCADPLVLGTEAANWGTYYDHRPHVVAGSIALGMSQLTRARI